jgi:outer membrane protein assembly factor BamB
LALIELDLTAQPGPAPTSIPATRRYRTPGLILALVLIFALGGAAAPDGLRWRFLGAIPSPPIPESPFQIDGDRVYVAGGAGNDRTVSAWNLAKPPAKLWSVTVPAREAGPDQVVYGDVHAQRAGGVVLITDGPGTTAVDPGTGRALWQTDIAVRPLTGHAIGLVQDPQFRPGTEYDQDGGAPGPLYFSATGVPHDQPPIRTDLRGVDLNSGKTAWSAQAPGSILAFDGPAGVVVLDSGELTLRSAATGTVLLRAALPPINGQQPSSGQLTGGLVLVDYGDEDSDARSLVAYSARTLQKVWQVPEPRLLIDPVTCRDVVCADDKSGAAVLDPATGRPLWETGGLDLVRFGDQALEWNSATGNPARLVDARNGDPLLSLADWQYDIDLSDDSPLLVRRLAAARTSLIAVAGGTPARLTVLGVTHDPVSDCAADAGYVVCRAAGELQVYAYRG